MSSAPTRTGEAGGREAAAPPSRRPPRSRLPVLLALGLGVAALLTAIVFIAVGEEGREIEITGAAETQRLLGGIPQDGPTLGSPSAPVAINVFNDLQCDLCARYHLRVIAPLIEELVRPGEARMTFRNVPIGLEEPGIAAFAAVAAAEQEREWQFVHLLYLNLEDARRRGVTDELLRAVGGGVLELDVSAWEEAIDSPEVAARVRADARAAAGFDLELEPGVVVQGPGGLRELPDSPSASEIKAAVGEVS